MRTWAAALCPSAPRPRSASCTGCTRPDSRRPRRMRPRPRGLRTQRPAGCKSATRTPRLRRTARRPRAAWPDATPPPYENQSRAEASIGCPRDCTADRCSSHRAMQWASTRSPNSCRWPSSAPIPKDGLAARTPHQRAPNPTSPNTGIEKEHTQNAQCQVYWRLRTCRPGWCTAAAGSTRAGARRSPARPRAPPCPLGNARRRRWGRPSARR